MSKAAARKRPLILVTQDYDPGAWQTLESGETEFESWLAVAQDLWGPGCYGPGQEEAVRQGANGVTITKSKIVGVIGAALGGIGPVAEENHSYFDVLDCDAEVLEYKKSGQGAAAAGKYLKLSSWNPLQPELPPGRYHGLIALGPISLVEDIVPLAKAIAKAVKPGGYLFLDEFYATDPSAGALISQGIARPGKKLYLHAQEHVTEALKGESLQIRSTASSLEPLMEAIRHGLTRGQEIVQALKAIPKPFRKQRMMAFANELQRAAVLYQALEKGLIKATQSIYYQVRDL